MHHDQLRTRRRQFGIERLMRKALNVVQEVRILADRPALNLNRIAIDGERAPLGLKRSDNGSKARDLDVWRHGFCLGIGRCATEIECIRTAPKQIPRMRERRLGLEKPSSVGERILGDVDDAEKFRPCTHRPG
jgi:hypothetical protein